MPWWAWLVIAAGLLGVEMFLVDAQFYLVFISVAAGSVGLVGLCGVALPVWGQWLAFALLCLVAMVAFRGRLYALARGRNGIVEEPVTRGDRVVVPARLAADQSCRVEYRGSTWTARNVDQVAIEAGKEAAIVNIEGLTLHVTPSRPAL